MNNHEDANVIIAQLEQELAETIAIHQAMAQMSDDLTILNQLMLLAAGGEVGDNAAIETTLVPIVDLTNDDTSGASETQAGPQENTCCIAARCQNPPMFTWLRCCGNAEACVQCIAEHVRLRGWSCPLCRGDLRAN